MNQFRNRIQAEPGTGKAFVWALGMFQSSKVLQQILIQRSMLMKKPTLL
jgi:hypothetical protein